MAIRAVSPDMTAPPASSKETRAGFSMTWLARATVSSANVPGGCSMRALSHSEPNTSSPGRRSVTALPTSSTTPARSVPRTAVGLDDRLHRWPLDVFDTDCILTPTVSARHAACMQTCREEP
jgi:hypothetical protein